MGIALWHWEIPPAATPVAWGSQSTCRPWSTPRRALKGSTSWCGLRRKGTYRRTKASDDIHLLHSCPNCPKQSFYDVRLCPKAIPLDIFHHFKLSSPGIVRGRLNFGCATASQHINLKTHQDIGWNTTGRRDFASWILTDDY